MRQSLNPVQKLDKQALNFIWVSTDGLVFSSLLIIPTYYVRNSRTQSVYENMKGRLTAMSMIEHKNETLKLLCTKSKFGNFKQGKIYEAKAYAKTLHNTFSHFRIEDEDGDLYTIDNKHLLTTGRLCFSIVDQ